MTEQAPDSYYRYCPGEEAFLLSDAICLGRRRINFHKCKGCQFNDDEHGRPSYTAQVLAVHDRVGGGGGDVQGDLIDAVFKAYDVRATVPDPLNEDIAWKLGNATAQFLRTSLGGYDRADSELQAMVVGRDMRKHSPMLSRAFIEGALATDTRVIDIGMVDTPQIYFAVNHLRTCGGAQTTASHNPANYNGFKICGRKAKPIGVNTGLQEIKRIAKAIARYPVSEHASAETVDLSEPYRAHIRRYLNAPRKLKVAVDASNGMAGRWFPILFSDVAGLTIIPLNFEHNGEFVHPPNPLVAANLQQVRDAVREHGADFGACFDGDADRCMFIDEHAKIVRCDVITALLAREYLEQCPGSTIVYDLRSSRIVAKVVEQAGGTPRRERVGHVFMKRAMAENNAVFGGELSGHFYFRDYFFCDSGAMAFAAVLNLLTKTGRSLSELTAPLQIYAASGERNYENDDQQGTLQRIAEKYSDAEVDRLDGVTVQYDEWWFNVRASNTEPLLRLNMEAESEELLQRKLAELTPLLGNPVDH